MKRAYDKPEPRDGVRFLIERLWPRGVRKTDLHEDGWSLGPASFSPNVFSDRAVGARTQNLRHQVLPVYPAQRAADAGAILALYFLHHQNTGTYTFEYGDLLNTPLSSTAALWIMLGFFVAFAVKLPLLPFHTWLPDAHTEAPTAGSVILAGLLLKTGTYGMILGRQDSPSLTWTLGALTTVVIAIGCYPSPVLHLIQAMIAGTG